MHCWRTPKSSQSPSSSSTHYSLFSSSSFHHFPNYHALSPNQSQVFPQNWHLKRLIKILSPGWASNLCSLLISNIQSNAMYIFTSYWYFTVLVNRLICLFSTIFTLHPKFRFIPVVQVPLVLSLHILPISNFKCFQFVFPWPLLLLLLHLPHCSLNWSWKWSIDITFLLIFSYSCFFEVELSCISTFCLKHHLWVSSFKKCPKPNQFINFKQASFSKCKSECLCASWY